MINLEQNPSLYEVLATFCMTRGYIEFDYARLPECKAKVNPKAPSRVKADNSTVSIAPPEKVKAFIDDAPRMTKDGNFILTVRNINRRDAGAEIDGETGEIIGESYFVDKSNAQRDGTTKEGYVKGEYLPRSYRLDVRADGKGISLNTIMVNLGRNGKARLFPNFVAIAPQNEIAEIAVPI